MSKCVFQSSRRLICCKEIGPFCILSLLQCFESSVRKRYIPGSTNSKFEGHSQPSWAKWLFSILWLTTISEKLRIKWSYHHDPLSHKHSYSKLGACQTGQSIQVGRHVQPKPDSISEKIQGQDSAGPFPIKSCPFSTCRRRAGPSHFLSESDFTSKASKS